MVNRKEDRNTSLSTAGHQEVQQQNGGRQLSEAQPRDLVPPVEIFEDGDAVYVVADMPGVSPQNLNVEIGNQVLEISGDITVEMPEGVSATFAEIRGSRYRRQFTLGRELDHEGVEATIKSGVLQLRLPKTDANRRRRIEIKAA
ncbi:MAG: Hsp20/alpha crystallin family protein [Ectothiorhodospiraceae bacterium]|nr:Hsp20/alpha crystallin family protein [Ectothiorhodospiraceae bacterium]MCH8504032.1 Hsp20/alpha crystallin family protein [Ectothiorhodospiraceae bacterium]